MGIVKVVISCIDRHGLRHSKSRRCRADNAGVIAERLRRLRPFRDKRNRYREIAVLTA
jgi:hypothetical protein